MTDTKQPNQLALQLETKHAGKHHSSQLTELPGETWWDIFGEKDPRAAELAATIEEGRKRALCSVGSPARATSGEAPPAAVLEAGELEDPKVRSHPPVHPCGGDVLERSSSHDSSACDTHTGASMSSSVHVDDGEAGAAHARPTPRQQTSHPPASDNGSLGRSQISRVLSDG